VALPRYPGLGALVWMVAWQNEEGNGHGQRVRTPKVSSLTLGSRSRLVRSRAHFLWSRSKSYKQ